MKINKLTNGKIYGIMQTDKDSQGMNPADAEENRRGSINLSYERKEPMRTVKRKAISIILLFIVSTMLIGVFSACVQTHEDDTISPDITLFSQIGNNIPNPKAFSAIYEAIGSEITKTISDASKENSNSTTVNIEITTESEVISAHEMTTLPETKTSLSNLEITPIPEEVLLNHNTYLSPIKGLEELSFDMVQEINDAWSEKYGYEYKGDVLIDLDYINRYVSSDRYLGTLDRFVVILRSEPLIVETKITVAGYEFYWGSAFNIWLYNDGEFYTLKEAYLDKLINKDFIRLLYYRNIECTQYFRPGDGTVRAKEPLTELELAEINQAWCAQFGYNEKFVESLSDNNYYYYGNYTGCYVFRRKMRTETGGEFIELAGLYMYLPNEYDLFAYKGGTFYTLQNAYTDGLLSIEDIEYIVFDNSLQTYEH